MAMTRKDFEAMDLAVYRTRVESAALVRAGETIYNSSETHAQIVVENLFRTAQGPIKILAGGLNNQVYGHPATLDAVEFFLSKGVGDLQAAIDEGDFDREGNPERRNYFAERFRDNPRVGLKILPPKKLKNYNYHFFVGGPDSYRFEADKTGKAAVAVFGDRDLTGRLSEIFQVFWENAVDARNRIDPPSSVLAS